jgi:hypothetical protein
MIVEENGAKVVMWRWRRRLFRWKEELVDVCNGVVLGSVFLKERRVVGVGVGE